MSDGIIDKSRNFLTEAFESGGGEAARAELLGNQLTQLLLAKHGNDPASAEFRQDVRSYGLALKKDNPGLRDELMYNQASLQRVVENGVEGLRTNEQQAEISQIKRESQRQAVGVDDMQRMPADEDRDEGEVKGSMQPKIAGQEGIEYDTGNS